MTRTVVLLGLVSLFTDISSESVSAVLPIYLTVVLGLTPLAYGFIDGIYQGVSALVRILGGWLADRGDHPKWIAVLGYGVSAVTRLALIPSQSMAAITGVITADRLGKGVRTAPRDALIAASSAPEALGRSFGVHRALDTTGAMIGPLLAFTILMVVPEDYTSVFVVSFAAAAIGLAILLLFVPDLRPRRDAVAARPAADAGVAPPKPSLRLLADRRFAMLVAAAGLLGVLTIGDGFLYLVLQQRDELATAYFPLLYVGTSFAYLVLAVPLGALADRVGRTTVFLGGHLALLAAYVCAGGPVGGAIPTILCLLFLGTYYAATDGVLAALTARVVQTPVRASGIATTQTAVALARFVSSVGFGLMWTTLGQRPAMVIVGVALVAALPCAWVLLRGVDAGPSDEAVVG
ncbi:MAG: MFS transporter [Jiangellaceae bacterium]